MQGKLRLHECTCSNSAFWLFLQKNHHIRSKMNRPNICIHGNSQQAKSSVARERFLDRGGLKIVRSCQRLGGEAPQTPLFSNARFYEQDTQQTYFDRHQLHARSSDRNFFRIIFYRGKQDCLLPLGFSNHARITTHVFVKRKYLNDKTKK